MANNDNIIYAKFNHGREITTDSRSQYAYGQVLKISGLHLPASFDADVSNKGDKQAKAVIGTDNELPIDDAYFLSGKDVIVMINVHAADKDGRTKYIIRIPVEKRPERADIELEPVEQDVISTAIATLNEAIEQTSANAESAENSANRAQQSAIDAETSATNASNSEALAQQYMERAETAAENAEQSETKAKASEEHAEQIASDIEQFTERAETASTNAESSASTASQYATSASNSANIATAKASEASTSAENASRSAINATGQATIATQKAELAELHATNASNSASEANRYERMAQSEAQSASQAASAATTARDEARTARNQAQTAKTQAETAKTQAQTANTNAQNAATRASTSATSASQSATSAEESAQSALASKEAIENMSVTAQTLNPDQQATVTKEVDSETGAITINYGIPRGADGEAGESGVYIGTTPPEDEDINVWIKTDENPDSMDNSFVITFTAPNDVDFSDSTHLHFQVTSDKTMGEVMSAYNNGKHLIGILTIPIDDVEIISYFNNADVSVVSINGSNMYGCTFFNTTVQYINGKFEINFTSIQMAEQNSTTMCQYSSYNYEEP